MGTGSARPGRKLLRAAILGVLGLGVGSAIVEHVLEMRDATRLTAGETFFSVGGRRVRYRLSGAGAPGPTVVLLTGAAASLEQWKDVQDALSADAPVFSYDRAGMGFSDPAAGHDATAEAEELAGLLHAPAIAPPFVLVCYSFSADLAKVFAATHRDIVKGFVFLDPAIPRAIPITRGSRGLTYARKFAKATVQIMLSTFFGYQRFRSALATRSGPAPSLSQARVDAVVMRFSHQLATGRDILDLIDSDHEAEAAPWFGAALPVGVLSSIDPDESQETKDVVAGHLAIAKSSTRGIFRPVPHVGHSKILTDPGVFHAVVDLIRTVEDEARRLDGAASSRAQ